MPMPARGKRMRLTTRISYDEYVEVAKRAQARGWTLSDYVAFCIRRQIGGKGPRERGVHHGSPSRLSVIPDVEEG